MTEVNVGISINTTNLDLVPGVRGFVEDMKAMGARVSTSGGTIVIDFRDPEIRSLGDIFSDLEDEHGTKSSQ